MLPEDVLALPPRVLTQDQREAYHRDGYLLVDSLIDGATIDRLNAVTAEFIERSRSQTASDRTFDLAPEHTAAWPAPDHRSNCCERVRTV